MALKTVQPAVTREEGAGAETSATAPAATTASASGASRKSLIFKGVAALAVIALLAAGGNWLLNGRYEIRTDNAHVRADITQIAARVSGYVRTVEVSDNQSVRSGDILFTIESEDYETGVAEARAALLQAEADAREAGARITSQKDRLAEASAARDAASAQADLSEADEKRFAELADKGWYPKARLEQAEAQRRTAAAQKSQAAAGLTVQRSQLTSAQAAAQSAEAKVEAARARLAAAELDLERTQVRAPVDGVVANRIVAQGQLLAPGQATLAIVPIGDAYVIANFKETQVEHMKPGQEVKLHVDAYPDLKVTGRVESISPATGGTFSLIPQDTATGNFTKIVQRVPVRISIDPEAQASGLMRSGLAVVATVSTREKN
jgi:membrane fusion protein (multidrug efflux system)